MALRMYPGTVDGFVNVSCHTLIYGALPTGGGT